MVGSPEPLSLAEFALRTLGFGDFRDVGMEEAKVVAYKVISDVSAFTDDVGQPALHHRHHQATASGSSIPRTSRRSPRRRTVDHEAARHTHRGDRAADDQST